MGQAFCLFASEWWRRKHEGGSWAWEPILETLSCQHLQWRHQLYPLIRQGLRSWKRPLLRRGSGQRLFLVTLACEGGLPLKMVRNDGARLQRYFRWVLEDYGVFHKGGDDAVSLAARRAQLLPKSLRQDIVYELAGRLVESIWELQDRVGDTEHPIAELDRLDEHWRNSLPFEIHDETARALLHSLVSDAHQARQRSGARFRTRRWLERCEGVWRLKAGVEIGTSLESSTLGELFALDRAVPPRFGLEIEAKASGVSELLGIGTLVRGRDGEPRVRLDIQETVFEDSLAAEGLRVWLLEGTNRIAQASPANGEPLGDLPWSFVASDRGPLLRGTGSIRLRETKSWMAVTEESEIPASLRRGCQLRGFDRRIVELADSQEIEIDGAICRIVLGAQASTRHQTIQLDGERLATSDREVFIGAPSVRLVDEPGRQDVASHAQLETRWRPAGSRDGWRPVGPSCFGEVQWRVASPEGPIFQDRLRVLPATTRIELEPSRFTRGAIVLAGVGDARVGLLEPADVDARFEAVAGGVRVELEARTAEAPSTVVLRLVWPSGQQLDLSLPYPSQGCRFIDAQGRVLDEEEIVPLARITELQAMVTTPDARAPVELRARLNANDLETDVPAELFFPTSTETHPRRLPLRNIRDRLGRLFSTTDELDAFIRLGFETQYLGVRPRPLNVSRFEFLLHPERETSRVRISTSEGGAPADVESLVVEAYRFWDPRGEPVELARHGDTEWNFPVDGLSAGPWLIVGREGGWCRTRPLRWTVPDEGGLPPEEELRSELQRAICCLDLNERRGHIARALEAMSQDSNDASWEAFEGYVDWLEILPPSSLDLMTQIQQHRGVLALSVVRASPERLDRIWDAMEQLPFEWFQIPASAWSDAARVHLESTRRVLQELGVEDVDPQTLLRGFLREGPGPSHRWFLRPITDWVRIKEIGDVQGGQALFDDGQKGPVLLQEIERELQNSIHRNAERRWPPGSEVLNAWMHSVAKSTRLREWETLRSISRRYAGYRRLTFLAPFAAALACVEDVSTGREVLITLRRFRAFDSTWFSAALELGLRLFLGRKILQEALGNRDLDPTANLAPRPRPHSAPARRPRHRQRVQDPARDPRPGAGGRARESGR